MSDWPVGAINKKARCVLGKSILIGTVHWVSDHFADFTPEGAEDTVPLLILKPWKIEILES